MKRGETAPEAPRVHRARSQLRGLSCDPELTREDRHTVQLQINRATALLEELTRRTAEAGAKSAGSGFWSYPTIGEKPLAAGQMARGPRTSNRHRPARSAWSFYGGLPSLGR